MSDSSEPKFNPQGDPFLKIKEAMAAHAADNEGHSSCLHCSINELLELSEAQPPEELTALIMALAQRLAWFTLNAGHNPHALIGQAVEVLLTALNGYLAEHLGIEDIIAKRDKE